MGSGNGEATTTTQLMEIAKVDDLRGVDAGQGRGDGVHGRSRLRPGHARRARHGALAARAVRPRLAGALRAPVRGQEAQWPLLQRSAPRL